MRERIGRENLLLRCDLQDRRREALRQRPHRQERGGCISWRPPTYRLFLMNHQQTLLSDTCCVRTAPCISIDPHLYLAVVGCSLQLTSCSQDIPLPLYTMHAAAQLQPIHALRLACGAQRALLPIGVRGRHKYSRCTRQTSSDVIIV